MAVTWNNQASVPEKACTSHDILHLSPQKAKNDQRTRNVYEIWIRVRRRKAGQEPIILQWIRCFTEANSCSSDLEPTDRSSAIVLVPERHCPSIQIGSCSCFQYIAQCAVVETKNACSVHRLIHCSISDAALIRSSAPHRVLRVFCCQQSLGVSSLPERRSMLPGEGRLPLRSSCWGVQL